MCARLTDPQALLLLHRVSSFDSRLEGQRLTGARHVTTAYYSIDAKTPFSRQYRKQQRGKTLCCCLLGWYYLTHAGWCSIALG